MQVNSLLFLSIKTQLKRLQVASRLVSKQEQYEFLLGRANLFFDKNQFLDALQRYKEAKDVVQKASKLSYLSLYPIMIGTGHCLIKLGNVAHAIDVLNEAQRAEPDHPLSYKLLASCYERNRDTRKEAESIEKYLQRENTLNPFYYSRLAILMNEEGSYSKAIDYGQKAINYYELDSCLTPNEKASELVSLSLNLANSYLEYEGCDSAIQFLESSISKVNSLNTTKEDQAELRVKIQSLQSKRDEIAQQGN